MSGCSSTPVGCRGGNPISHSDLRRRVHDPGIDPWIRTLTALQGVYYALTGLWALVSLSTFLIVTGPKTDLWLVQTVGALVLVMGAAMVAAAWERRFPLALWVLTMGGAAGFLTVDVVFHLEGKIGSVYLLDAVAQGAFLLAWGALAFKHGTSRARRG